MPYKSEKTAINNPAHDKRVKLTDADREKIREEYATGLISQRALAEKYGVSRRLISFVLDPEKEKINKQQFAQRQKEGRYYDKEKHKQYTNAHRKYKHELYKKGLLNPKEDEGESK